MGFGQRRKGRCEALGYITNHLSRLRLNLCVFASLREIFLLSCRSAPNYNRFTSMNDLVKHANRRAFLAACAVVGVNSHFVGGALSALAAQEPTLHIYLYTCDPAAHVARVSIS